VTATDAAATGRAAARGRPRDPALDSAILDAALEIFVEQGISALSIEQVARRAGVGKPTIYRRWSDKEQLVADAIEHRVSAELAWPTPAEASVSDPYELVRRNISAAARTAADPAFRGLIAAIYGSAVTHPALLRTYWEHYILPRRTAAIALLRRARDLGTVAADADLDVLVDMLAGAVTYRVLQPEPPSARQLRCYLEVAYRQVGLLP
jgi:AcrR family transcriptional regulator